MCCPVLLSYAERMNPSAARALVLTVAVLGGALAHGESPVVNLRGAVLCLDPASVQLRFEDTPAARQEPVRVVKDTLSRSLTAGLRAGRVRHEVRASCLGHVAPVRILAEVRYLNPRNYVGFGDPAYSYTLTVRVGSPGGFPASGVLAPVIQFASSLSDIHSEARTGKSVANLLTGLGQVQVQDLVRAWQKDNPQPQGGP